MAGPQAEGFVANSRLRADLLGGREHTQKGQGLPVHGPAQAYHYGQNHPAESWATHRALVTGADGITTVAPLADLQTPPAFQSFVDDDIHASTSFDKGLDEEPEQLSACLQGSPEGTG